MRKSLLITSALGFATVLPVFAMAGAAAGSSAAACGSGFFAQFDAKIMSAKLQIKNENKKDESGKLNPDDAEKIILAEQEAAYKEKMELIFAGLSEAQLVKLRDTVANGGLNLSSFIGTTASPINLDTLGFKRELALVLSAGIDNAAITAARAVQSRTDQSLNSGAKLRAFDILNASEADLDTAATTAAAAGNAPGGDAPTPASIGLGLADTKTWNAAVDNMKDIVAVAKADPRQLSAAQAGAVQAGAGFAFDGGCIAAGTDGFLVDSLSHNLETLFSTNNNNSPIEVSLATTTDLKTVKKIFVIASAGGTATYNDKATFATAQAAFLATTNAEARAKEIVANGWFQGAVARQKKAIENNNLLIDEKTKAVQEDRLVHHNALAGGIGATVGWWQNLGGFALSFSGSGDYHWGTFRTMDDKSGETVKAADKRRLGFGFQGNVGAHYIVSPSTTLGILIGLRGQQLQFGQTNTTDPDSKGDYASKWMLNPVVSAQARTFFTDNVYSALTVGYIIPMSEKDYGLENTKIDKDAKIRFQGLTGAFSVGMVF